MGYNVSFKEKQSELIAPEALYLHVPFCLAKCRYCDFYSVKAGPGQMASYARCAAKELQTHADGLKKPLKSVFFGGGTPTALDLPLLAGLIETIAPMTDAATEFSVEGNPGALTRKTAQILLRGGVNRVNLGVQSFDDSELKLLGRIHDGRSAGESFAMLRDAGVKNLGLDMIYGIPGQSLQTWEKSLKTALALGPEHLSCYGLSYESGTELFADRLAGKITEMDERLQERCYRLAIEMAAAAGLEHYEISNFALPGRRCRHNLTYWHNQPYLGIGPGATSYVGLVRRRNFPNIERYVQAIDAGNEPPGESETLRGRQLMAETLMLGLRLVEGVDRRVFGERFGQDPLEAFKQSTSRYIAQGALIASPTHLRLASEALFVADTILADILAEA